MKFRGPERHLWCIICGDPFTTRHATKLTCSSGVLTPKNQRRLNAAMVAQAHSSPPAGQRRGTPSQAGVPQRT